MRSARGVLLKSVEVDTLKLAKEKTEQLYLASIPSELPDLRKGVRVKAS